MPLSCRLSGWKKTKSCSSPGPTAAASPRSCAFLPFWRSYFGGAIPRREVTLLLQEPYLLKESVFRNVTIGLMLRGQKGNLQNEYAAAMEMAGFEDPQAFAQRRPAALSGGEKQRVALASRLILKPAVLLLDEPTSFVDARSAGIIVAALKKLCHTGCAIVCATHDPALVEALGARCLRLETPA